MTYPTVSNLKTYMGTSSSADDGILAYVVNGAINWVEVATNRKFVAVNATRSFPLRGPWVSEKRLRLNFFEDLASVDSVTNGDGVAISSGNYWLEPFTAPYLELHIEPSSGVFLTDGGNGGKIAVAGDWGYSASCPDAVFQAVLEIARLSYNSSRSGAGGSVAAATQNGLLINPGAHPEWVKQIVRDFTRGGL